MTLFRPFALTLLAATVAGFAACRRGAPEAPAPRALEENHCWWAVFRTPLPPDSVAVHFARAFEQLGLRGGAWTQRGDTAWARAEPTRLDAWSGGTFSARVIAVRKGDSTHFRHFVGVAPPAGGWPAAHDSVTADGRHIAVNPAGATIGFCGALGRAAQVHGTAPAEPDGEEKLDIWTRPSPED
jgi:hypothetical protein